MNPGPGLFADSIDYARAGKQILTMAYVDALPGTVTALVGRSGAGKTTLLEIIAGLRRARTGTVTCQGEPVEAGVGIAGRHEIGFLPSRRWLPESLTGRELLNLAGQTWKVDWAAGLNGMIPATLLESPMKNLSSGQRKLVEVAIVVVCGSTTIILDEPFLHLDPIEREAVGRLLTRRASLGGAVLFADHDPHMTLTLADRLYRIEKGQTVFVSDFRDRPYSEWFGRW